ncbi:MAG: IS21 family transposase [Bacteroidales bacterium]|nr:IS21 family transposase [Bacteroidales bacterium]
MSRQGHSISYIAEYLGANWRSVKKLLSMDERAYEQSLSLQVTRCKELAPYEGFVKIKLEQFPGTSAAQLHDWLKEFDGNFPGVSPKTVYNFVMWVRQQYHIPKIKHHRDYFIVEELPYGKQAQVDFGEYNMRKSTGGVKKVCFFTIVLSRSRYKYVYFSDVPFTSVLAVKAHEKAFEYFKGIPKEIVYDQDKVFIHDENAGDLLLTTAFKQYVESRKFTLYFCRKSDPETKGKVENAVKYVKQNFLYNRSYFDLDTLNDDALSWLNRTANHEPHGKTKASPFEQWDIEKSYLSGFTPLQLEFDQGMLYTVRKDNTISYKSNLYSLPQGTWSGKGTQVYVMEEDGTLLVRELSGKELCRCNISTGKGQTIINNDHKRDKGAKIDQLIIDVAGRFASPSNAARYFEHLRLEKPRYIRDQIQIINKCFEELSKDAADQALEFCTQRNIYSAADFKSVASKIHQQQNRAADGAKIPQVKTLPENMSKMEKMQPHTSEIIDYESIMSNKN